MSNAANNSKVGSFLLIIVKTRVFSVWFHGENDIQKYSKYFAIYFISRSLAITEAEEFKVLS